METDIVSLDDRLLQAFSGSAIATAVDKQTITNRIEDPNLVTDPKELAISQEMISDYNLYVLWSVPLLVKESGLLKRYYAHDSSISIYFSAGNDPCRL